MPLLTSEKFMTAPIKVFINFRRVFFDELICKLIHTMHFKITSLLP